MNRTDVIASINWSVNVGVEIQISNRSQELINNYIEACYPHQSQLQADDNSIDLELLLSWLNDEITPYAKKAKKSKQEIEFIFTKLRAELLRDLFNFMPDTRKLHTKKEEKTATPWNKLKFILLAISGTIFAACEGFDSITTMMGVLSLPSWAILLVGLAFSVLSVVVFYGFELVQVSQNLGVNLRDAPKLLDVYLLQLEEIKSIRRKINTYSLAGKSSEELAQLKSTIEMLQCRFKALTESSKQFKLALDSNSMQTAKYIFSGVAGLLFFGSGFFAGQSVGVFMLGLIIAAATPAAWPVVIFSLLVGASAFSLYWYVERVGLQKLISGWFGLNEDKIEQLCDQDKLTKEAEKLENLKEKIIDTSKLTIKLSNLEHELHGAEIVVHQELIDKADLNSKQTEKFKTSSLYSFFIAPSEAVNHPHGNLIGDAVSFSQ